MELQLNNDFLEEICEPFDFNDPQYDPVDLSDSLTMLRHKYKGLGLAANQAGLRVRVISIRGIDSCLFNPRIVHSSDTQVSDVEGCLSYPGLSVKVPRAKEIRVRYTDALGQTHSEQYIDITARIIQHEIDHLDAIQFFDRAHWFHKERAARKWKQIRRRISK